MLLAEALETRAAEWPAGAAWPETRVTPFESFSSSSTTTGVAVAVDCTWGNFACAYEFAAGESFSRDRYLDPGTGRWLQPDRLGVAAGPNFYQYVGSKPTLYRDPSGQLDNATGRYLAKAPAPCLDSVTCTALYQPIAYLEILQALGEAADGILALEQLRQHSRPSMDTASDCPLDHDSLQEFHRGDSLERARVSVSQGFTSASIGTGYGQYGAGLYVSRDINVARRYAQDAKHAWGSGAVIWILISSRIWDDIRSFPGVEDDVSIAGEEGLQTFIPFGAALTVFDTFSGKQILQTY